MAHPNLIAVWWLGVATWLEKPPFLENTSPNYRFPKFTVPPSANRGVMFDLETNSGGCRAAIAAGRSSACGASSGTDYGTSPSADMFVWRDGDGGIGNMGKNMERKKIKSVGIIWRIESIPNWWVFWDIRDTWFFMNRLVESMGWWLNSPSGFLNIHGWKGLVLDLFIGLPYLQRVLWKYDIGIFFLYIYMYILYRYRYLGYLMPGLLQETIPWTLSVHLRGKHTKRSRHRARCQPLADTKWYIDR